jgi:hypothetical protein
MTKNTSNASNYSVANVGLLRDSENSIIEWWYVIRGIDWTASDQLVNPRALLGKRKCVGQPANHSMARSRG